MAIVGAQHGQVIAAAELQNRRHGQRVFVDSKLLQRWVTEVVAVEWQGLEVQDVIGLPYQQVMAVVAVVTERRW